MANEAFCKKENSSNRDPAISIIRVIAFLFVITCHIMQYYDFELAWWFNVGVQIFLCLSGYLYGRKEFSDPLHFYKKQFFKILIPYYLVIIVVITVQLIFASEEISIVHIVKALLVYGTLSGGEHLWFVPTILFCYILTPLLDILNNKIFEKKQPVFYIFLVFVVLNVVIKLFVRYYHAPWIVCFYLGHVLGKNDVKLKVSKKFCNGLAYSLAISLVSIQIVISYILKIQMTGYLNSIYGIMCNYGHVFLGISIFLVLRDVFAHIRVNTFVSQLINFLDSISYEGYLVHQFFILGSFSFLSMIGSPVIAVIGIFAATFFFGYIIKIVCDKTKQMVLNLNCKN